VSFPETIRPGAVIRRNDQPVPNMSGWRTGKKPTVKWSQCVDCLICWSFCPDAAMILKDGHFVGIDYQACKGCEICVTSCPTQAVYMVPEETPVSLRKEIGGVL